MDLGECDHTKDNRTESGRSSNGWPQLQQSKPGKSWKFQGGRKEMFYLTTHSTHFIYGYMASNIWLRTILIVRKETRCRHIGYSFRLTARVLLYAPSQRQDNTYHGLCYTSRGALAGTRNSSMGPPHEGSIRRPIAPYANALPLSYNNLSRGNQGSFRWDIPPSNIHRGSMGWSRGEARSSFGQKQVRSWVSPEARMFPLTLLLL